MYQPGAAPATPSHGAPAHIAEFDEVNNRVIITLNDGHRFSVSSKDRAVQKKMQQICASFNRQLTQGRPDDIEKTIKYLQKTAAAPPQGGAPAPKSVYHCVYNPKTNKVAFLRDKGTKKGGVRLEITAAASTHKTATNALKQWWQGRTEAGSREPTTIKEMERWPEEEGVEDFDPGQYVGQLEQHLKTDIKHLYRLQQINTDLGEKRTAGIPITVGYIDQQLQWVEGLWRQINSRSHTWNAADQFAKGALAEVQQRYQTVREDYDTFMQQLGAAERELRTFRQMLSPGPSMNEGPVSAPASSGLPASADKPITPEKRAAADLVLGRIRDYVNQNTPREKDLGEFQRWLSSAKNTQIVEVDEIKRWANWAQEQLGLYQQFMQQLETADVDSASPELAQFFSSARSSFEHFYHRFNQTTQELFRHFAGDLQQP